MDRIEIIRTEEKIYHDYCYEHYQLFEEGSWLHKPVRTVLDGLEQFVDYEALHVLDLGAGIGRNSIPIAQFMQRQYVKEGHQPIGYVDCVDLLPSAIDQLEMNSKKYGVEELIRGHLSDIEGFSIAPLTYDYIVSVSALEHVRSVQHLESKLTEMVAGTKENGVNCIIISSNIRELLVEENIEIDPMFELNLTTEHMLELLDSHYEGWEVERRLVKSLQYSIQRQDKPVQLSSDCITYVAKKLK